MVKKRERQRSMPGDDGQMAYWPILMGGSPQEDMPPDTPLGQSRPAAKIRTKYGFFGGLPHPVDGAADVPPRRLQRGSD